MPVSGLRCLTATRRSLPRRAAPTAAGCIATIWPNNGTKKPSPGAGGGRLFRIQTVWRLLLCRRELLFQGIESHGADNQLGADDIARCTADAERVGKLHILVDRDLDLVAVHILLDPRHVEARVFGSRKRVRLVGRAAAAQQLLVEVD